METEIQLLDAQSTVRQFWEAPDEALFRQPVLVAVTGLSAAFFERARWTGEGGPRYLKVGRAVRYRKRDVIGWLDGPRQGREVQPAQRASAPARP